MSAPDPIREAIGALYSCLLSGEPLSAQTVEARDSGLEALAALWDDRDDLAIRLLAAEVLAVDLREALRPFLAKQFIWPTEGQHIAWLTREQWDAAVDALASSEDSL